MEHLTGEYLYHIKQEFGLSRLELAAKYGLTVGQVGGRVQRYKKTLEGTMPPEDEAKLNLFDVVMSGQPLRLSGNWTIVSDVHAPTTDLDLARLVVPSSQRFGVRQLLLLGDLINVDWASKYPVLVSHPDGTDETESAKYLLEEWLHYFDQIYWLPGNHEDRFLKLNTGNLSMNHLVRTVSAQGRGKLEASEFDHCWIDTPNGPWFCCHGTNYSVNQLVVADQLAQKYQANIICGHQHHFAMGMDRYKNFIVVDNGGLFDPDKMAYVTMRASKMPRMQRGFSVLVDGYPMLFGEPFTNWNVILEDAA
jgi:UDP-2,3-diacylglucosamine pyrophosphatase LpxH